MLERIAVALVGTCLSLGVPMANAGTYDLYLQVEPTRPSTYEPTILNVDGLWPAGCMPQFAGTVVETDTIDVYLLDPTLNPEIDCSIQVAPWHGEVRPGLLTAGAYTVTLRLASSLPPSPESSTILATVSFEVSERVGARLFRIAGHKMVCVNRTTGQRVVVPRKRGPFNCESAGLVVQQGDTVAVRGRGFIP